MTNPAATSEKPLRIAVAEDQPDLRAAYLVLLRTLGHEIVGAAGDGLELVELCERTRPDLVISDIAMPLLDGIDAAHRIYGARPTAIILVSAHHDRQLIQRAQAEYIMAYLVKPTTTSDLETAIAIATTRFEQIQGLHREVDAAQASSRDGSTGRRKIAAPAPGQRPPGENNGLPTAKPFGREEQSDFKNDMLSQLSPQSLDSLRGHLHSVELEMNRFLYEPGQAMQHAYFPDSGIISVLSVMANGNTMEVGMIGREGMAGSELLAGGRTAPFRYFVQAPGAGRRIDAERLQEAAEHSAELRQFILQYEAGFRTQVMQGMACNGLHSAQQRCCRWLLMSRDRLESDARKVSHEFLSTMLGVRRSTITEVLQPLQEAGLIRSHRGTITILDRAALEAQACECYRVIADATAAVGGNL